MKRATDSIDTATAEELMHLLQGFRHRKSKDMYQRVRKTLVARKDNLFPKTDKHRHEQIVNLLFSLASNMP